MPLYPPPPQIDYSLIQQLPLSYIQGQQAAQNRDIKNLEIQSMYRTQADEEAKKQAMLSSSPDQTLQGFYQQGIQKKQQQENLDIKMQQEELKKQQASNLIAPALQYANAKNWETLEKYFENITPQMQTIYPEWQPLKIIDEETLKNARGDEFKIIKNAKGEIVNTTQIKAGKWTDNKGDVWTKEPDPNGGAQWINVKLGKEGLTQYQKAKINLETERTDAYVKNKLKEEKKGDEHWLKLANQLISKNPTNADGDAMSVEERTEAVRKLAEELKNPETRAKVIDSLTLGKTAGEAVRGDAPQTIPSYAVEGIYNGKKYWTMPDGRTYREK